MENDTVKVDRKAPAFLGWSNFNVLQRNQAEIVDKTFGKGKIVSIYYIYYTFISAFIWLQNWQIQTFMQEGKYEVSGDSQEDAAEYFASQEDNIDVHGDSEPEV